MLCTNFGWTGLSISSYHVSQMVSCGCFTPECYLHHEPSFHYPHGTSTKLPYHRLCYAAADSGCSMNPFQSYIQKPGESVHDFAIPAYQTATDSQRGKRACT